MLDKGGMVSVGRSAMLKRAKRLWAKEGLLGLTAGIGRYVYWNFGIQRQYHQLRYMISNKIVRHEINGITSEFSASNVAEYTRNKTLHGEKEVLNRLLQSLEPNDVFYDIGANVGTYSCFADKVVTNGCVISFEPHPVNVPRLRTNIELNESKARVFELALSDEIGTITLTGDKNDEPGIGSSSLATMDEDQGINVKVTTGDELVSNKKIPHPSVLKIDIEGAEGRALSGMSKILESDDCHTVFCEIHPTKLEKYGDSEKDVFDKLEKSGFKIKKINNRSSEYFIKASKK